MWATTNSTLDVGWGMVPIDGYEVHVTDSRGGILAEDGAVVTVSGTLSIAGGTPPIGPADYGIRVKSAHLRSDSCPPLTTRTISGVQKGFEIDGGGEVTFTCALTMENNQTGAVVSGSSQLILIGDVIIRNNIPPPGQSAGVRGIAVSQGSTLTLNNGVQIVNNGGIGVMLSDHSTGVIAARNPSIKDNTGAGIVVTRGSTLMLALGGLPPAGPPVISGNGGKNLVCSVQGLAWGDNSGIPKNTMDCKTFEQLPTGN